MIQARAQRFAEDNGNSKSIKDNADVPPEFWWAGDGAALKKDWAAGDFETWVAGGAIRLQAFGVTFSRSHVEQSKPTVTQAQQSTRQRKVSGNKIFIGHGSSLIWRELKDFLKDRLHLEHEEFNRESHAGVATADRLADMLDAATFAFLVMTAEDELPDGKLIARLNVIHEAGLFQGRLGFKRAIILLAEGCEEFSNIHGLGQIRFPKGNISAKFEEVRQVLERERVIEHK
jgi:predicted nucleotide-binding protein